MHRVAGAQAVQSREEKVKRSIRKFVCWMLSLTLPLGILAGCGRDLPVARSPSRMGDVARDRGHDDRRITGVGRVEIRFDGETLRALRA